MKELFAIPELLTLDGQSVTDGGSLALFSDGPNSCGNGCDSGCHSGAGGSCSADQCADIIES